MPYKDPVKRKEYHDRYYVENKESFSSNAKEYYLENKEVAKERSRIYRIGNKEKLQRYHLEYSLKNKEHKQVYDKKYKKENRAKVNTYVMEKKKKDVQFKLQMALRGRLLRALKMGWKSGSAVRDLGCTIPELKFYLEGQFKDGMTWDNWTRADLNDLAWHIDHKVPLTFFDLTNREQFLQAVHYTNLQPMWAKENIKKSNKVTV